MSESDDELIEAMDDFPTGEELDIQRHGPRFATVREIVADYLKRRGYDGLYGGLYGEYDCECLLGGEFMNCDEPHDCKPGYKRQLPPCEPGVGVRPGGRDWTIGPEKEKQL